MFGLNPKTARRFFLSAAVLLTAAAVLLVWPWVGHWPTVRPLFGWLHDSVWLPVLGYGFHWGAPWSQVAAATCGVALAAGWLAWVLDVPVLSLPALLLSWLYLGHVQPSGRLVLWLRRCEFRLFRIPVCDISARSGDVFVRGKPLQRLAPAQKPLKRFTTNLLDVVQSRFRQSRPVRTGPARPGGAHRDRITSKTVLLLVAEALARRDEERVRAAELRSLGREAGQVPDSLRESARQRLLFLADYYCPTPAAAAVCLPCELERAAVWLARGLAVGGKPDTEARERLRRLLQTYYREQFPALAPSDDVAVRLFGSPPDSDQPVPRSLAILDLLLRYEETGDFESLEAAGTPIRRGLTRLWQICQTLDGLRLQTVPPFQLEELRRSCGNAARGDLAGLGMGDVLETWLAALLRRGEFETAASAARTALELASPAAESHLDAIRWLPWDDSDKEALAALLRENRVERPEAIRYLSARAWLGLRQALPTGPSADFALDQALADCFERGDFEWIAAADNICERSAN